MNLAQRRTKIAVFRGLVRFYVYPTKLYLLLPAAVHVESLSPSLSVNAAIVGNGGQALINFARYVKFMRCLDEEGLQRFKPPDSESRDERGKDTAYLSRCLATVDMSDTIVEELISAREVDERQAHDRDARSRDDIGVLLFTRV